MSDNDAWDADDFEPELPSKAPTDKWDGEDEEDVKDNWEDEEEEKKEAEASAGGTAYQRPKKKSLAERIAEKEAAKKKEDEEKRKQKEGMREMTAEERQTEKNRLKKIQEKESLALANSLFGVAEVVIDKMVPETEEEYTQFADALKQKITFFEESKHYSAFIVKFINDIAVGLDVEDVKKLGVNMTSLFHEKDRVRKELEKKKKKKTKATIKVVRGNDFADFGGEGGDYGGGYDDDDDFI